MQTISIFTAEKDAGLEEIIQNQNSIAFVSPVSTIGSLCVADNNRAAALARLEGEIQQFLAKADQYDPDLFHVLSILVTTSWNKNDDVFDREEVWAARKTPSHKQTNLDHDDDKIVGHIVTNWAVDYNYNIIEDNTTVDSLPDVFHLLTSSVIYRQRQHPETQALIAKLIAEIEAGTKYVSMECIFHGFDYGLIGPEGNKYVIKRTAESSFLTSHLRCYGGSGIYDNFRIGRVLRRITFSGKGFVDKPANPDSIIFDRNYLNFSGASNLDSLTEDGVCILAHKLEVTENEKESISMADDSKLLEGQIQDLKASLKEALDDNAKLKAELSAANVRDLNDQIETLKAANLQTDSDLAKADEKIADLQKQLDEAKSSLAEAAKKNKELEENCASLKKEIRDAVRTAMLVDGGFDKEAAQKKVELFASLSDDQFQDLANELIAAKCDKDKEKKQMQETEADDDETSAEVEDADIISSAESDKEADLSVASDDVDESMNTTRANLIKWVTANVLKREVEESK